MAKATTTPPNIIAKAIIIVPLPIKLKGDGSI